MLKKFIWSQIHPNYLHIILKIPVLKPLGSDMLWILYNILFSCSEIFTFSICSHNTGPLSIHTEFEQCRDDFTKILNPWETSILDSIFIVEMLSTDCFIANIGKWIILPCCVTYSMNHSRKPSQSSAALLVNFKEFVAIQRIFVIIPEIL